MKGMVAQGLPKWVKKGATAFSDEFLRSARDRRVALCKRVHILAHKLRARAHTHTCTVLVREHART